MTLIVISEASNSITFMGGTALRFLENLPRYSEVLDYSLTSVDKYQPLKWFEKIKRDLVASGFDTIVTWNDRPVVHRGWIRIASILKELGLSENENQQLSIKVEIDTRPPSGAVIQRTILNRQFTFVVSHFDLPSLMAGKLHALLVLPYPKGRDWYDLIWYRSHRPPILPNTVLLQNALDQTEGTGKFKANEWAAHLKNKLNSLDVDSLKDDVQRFLERPEDKHLLEKENLMSVL